MKYYKSVSFKALHKLHMYIDYYLFLNREKMIKSWHYIAILYQYWLFLPYLHTLPPSPPSPASPAAFLYCLCTNTSSYIWTLLKFIQLSYDIEKDLGRLVQYIYIIRIYTWLIVYWICVSWNVFVCLNMCFVMCSLLLMCCVNVVQIYSLFHLHICCVRIIIRIS